MTTQTDDQQQERGYGACSMADTRRDEAREGLSPDLATKDDRAEFKRRLTELYKSVSSGQLRREAEVLGVLGRGDNGTRSGMTRAIVEHWIAEIRPAEHARNLTKQAERARKPKVSRGPRKTYPPEVKAWVKKGQDLLGPGFVPGPKQHLAVRAVVGDQDVETLVGMSQYNLQHYATTGAVAKQDRAQLKELADKVDDVGARNRNLAAILCVIMEERGQPT
jgi:hypothetical protein